MEYMIDLYCRERKIGSLHSVYWDRALSFSCAQLWHMEGGVVVLNPDLSFQERSHYLSGLARLWREGGLISWWRGEHQLFRDHQGGAFALVERALFRVFSWESPSVYAFVWSYHREEMGLWLAKRSAQKIVAPGAWDLTVNGGVVGFESVWQALLREGFEEAGLLFSECACEIHIAAPYVLPISWSWDYGVQRKRAYVYHFYVGEEWAPRNQDGEVESFMWISWYELRRQLPHMDVIRDAKHILQQHAGPLDDPSNLSFLGLIS